MNTDETRIENFQSESVTRADRISEIEGKAAKGSGERAGQRASFKIRVNLWLIYYPTAAITLSSMAIGVGNAVTSTVVRVGFGLPGPAKYSA
jgi:hypothetical protein